jgi:MFS family permease
MLMRIRRSEPKARQNILNELREGFGYIIGFAPIRSILTLIAAFSLLGFPYTVLLPVFASTVLHGGPHTLGFLTAASGTGALISAITLALRKTIVGLGKVISAVAFTFGAALMALGISRTLWLSLPVMLITGFSMMQMMAASNTIMQTILEQDKRGRVMSFYSLSFMGVLPFGSLISGALADRFGAPTTVVAGGALCIAVATWFSIQLKYVRRIVRPIYIQLGIIPEVAEGLQAAASLQTPPER